MLARIYTRDRISFAAQCCGGIFLWDWLAAGQGFAKPLAVFAISLFLLPPLFALLDRHSIPERIATSVTRFLDWRRGGRR